MLEMVKWTKVPVNVFCLFAVDEVNYVVVVLQCKVVVNLDDVGVDSLSQIYLYILLGFNLIFNGHLCLW